MNLLFELKAYFIKILHFSEENHSKSNIDVILNRIFYLKQKFYSLNSVVNFF